MGVVVGVGGRAGGVKPPHSSSTSSLVVGVDEETKSPEEKPSHPQGIGLGQAVKRHQAGDQGRHVGKPDHVRAI